jgi:hypothetical protein
MERDPQQHSTQHAAPLVVADWTVDPEFVVTAIRAHLDGTPAVRLLVPAWLHGIDWVGDPWASVPCARRQLERIAGLCASAGLAVASVEVGDPDPVSAICDAAAAGAVDRILLFARGRHVSPVYPFGVAPRAARLTGVPVQGVCAPRAPRTQRRRGFAGGHCQAPQPA